MEEDPCSSSSCCTNSISSLESSSSLSSSLSSNSSLSTQSTIPKTPSTDQISIEKSSAQTYVNHGYGRTRSTHSRVLSRLKSSRGGSFFFFPPSRPHLYHHRLIKTLRSVIHSLLCNTAEISSDITSSETELQDQKNKITKLQHSSSSSRSSDTENSVTDINIRRRRSRNPRNPNYSSIDSLISLLSSSSISGCNNSVTSSARASSAMKARHVVTGTLYGQRSGRMRFAVQDFSDADSSRSPLLLLLQLGSSTSSLIREMAVGPVRIALECRVSISRCNGTVLATEKNPSSLIKQRLSASPVLSTDEMRNITNHEQSVEMNLLDERLWTMYCNGKKLGFAHRRACTESDLHILSLMQAVSMGAGILPISQVSHLAGRTSKSDYSNREINGNGNGDNSVIIKPRDGEILYMRSQFERVIGSPDSEAFYMMNPAGHGGPELSLFLLRINDN